MLELRREVGSQIRIWRRERKLTQAALAERAGLSRDMVGFVERGRAAPSLDALERISRALDVSLGVLFGGPNNSAADGAANPGVNRILRIYGLLDKNQQIIAERVIKALLER